MDCAHFYHCWADGGWRVPVEEHIEALTSSGFPGPVTVGLVGTPTNRAEARRVFEQAFPNTRFVEADHGHEEHTLRLVHEHVNQGATSAVLYAHTYGAWHSWNATERVRITRGLIAGWEHCLELLADDPQVDLVGYMYMCLQANDGLPPRRAVILKGNFWAAASDYLRTLRQPLSLAPALAVQQRAANEGWIQSGSRRVRAVWPEEATSADLTPHPPAFLEWRGMSGRVPPLLEAAIR